MRISRHDPYEGPKPYARNTEPNQAFTPRQIIEQFARNELTAKIFEPSDMINDDNYTDDEMVDNVVTFEDEFDAITYMRETKVVKDEPKKDESLQDVDDGNKEPSNEPTE